MFSRLEFIRKSFFYISERRTEKKHQETSSIENKIPLFLQKLKMILAQSIETLLDIIHIFLDLFPLQHLFNAADNITVTLQISALKKMMNEATSFQVLLTLRDFLHYWLEFILWLLHSSLLIAHYFIDLWAGRDSFNWDIKIACDMNNFLNIMHHELKSICPCNRNIQYMLVFL